MPRTATRKHDLGRYFMKNLAVVVGLVLVWRGIWHLLDVVDVLVFDGDVIYTSVFGILLGFAILYLPDKDLKELEKL